MQPKTLLLIPCFLLALVLAGCAKTAEAPSNAPAPSPGVNSSPATSQAKVTSKDVVKASVPETELSPGGSATAEVRLEIKEGYHINANPPSEPQLIATELKVEPSEGINAGKPIYPAGMTKKFTFSDKPLSVYQTGASIKLPLQAASSATKGPRTVPLKLRVQACDDLACYPPGTIDVPLQLAVK